MRERIRPAIGTGAALLALLLFLPGTAHAGSGQFLVTGPITGIDDGDVKPAGKSGRFVVKNRHVTGTLQGLVDGDLLAAEPFTFTFADNVAITTQSGNLHGVLSLGPYDARVVGKSEIGLTTLVCPVPDGVTCIQTPVGNFVPGLIIHGKATFIHGTTGHGTASAWLVPMIDPATGHIVGVIAGQMTLSSP